MVDFRGKVVLAPMVRIGELPTRLLALKYGADLVWGPETVDKKIIGSHRVLNERTSCIEFIKGSSPIPVFRLHPIHEKGKLIFQMGTADPELAVEAAKVVAHDVAGIECNAGCPKHFSMHSGMGAALLRSPERLESILKALVAKVGKPYNVGISVKIRILESQEETENLVRKLCRTGIIGLTVHCRTIPMRPRERALRDRLASLAKICRQEGVACLANGDVRDRAEALEVMQAYGVDGCMIATAAEKNPSCFREDGPLPWQPVIKSYIEAVEETANGFPNTKYCLLSQLPGKTAVYAHCQKAKTLAEIKAALGFWTSQEVDGSRHIVSDEWKSFGGTLDRAKHSETAMAA